MKGQTKKEKEIAAKQYKNNLRAIAKERAREYKLDAANPYRTDPQKRSKMPMKINLALRILSPFCPVCGDCVQDKR